MDKPTFSKSVSAGTRVYHFDAYADTQGQRFLSITEAPIGTQRGQRLKQRIFLYEEDARNFSEAFLEATAHIGNSGNEIRSKCQ